MKNNVIVATALALTLLPGVVGCGSSSTETSDTSETVTVATDDAAIDTEPTETTATEEAPTLQFDSMADAFAAGGTDGTSTWDESHYIYIYNDGAHIIRVTADLSKEMYDEMYDSNFDEQTIDELVGPLPVAGVDTFDLPSQDSLSALAGKTGQELMDAGFVMDSFSAVNNETYCMATKYPFSYLIMFDGAVSDADSDDAAGAVKDMVAIYATVGTLSEDAMYE